MSQHTVLADSNASFLQRHALAIGIALMFVLTWPIDLAHAGRLPFTVPFPVYLFLGWGFVAAALIMTAATGGRVAVVGLLRRFLIWRVGWRWYAALLLLPTIMILAVLLNAAIAHEPIDFSTVFAHRIFGASASLPMFVVPFFLTDAIANGEEIGWRGYVLPRLQVRHSALVASLIVGVIWALWHIPKFLVPGNTSSFGLFLIRVVADAVLYTWLYNNTKGSLLMTTAFHAGANTAGVFLPIANTVGGQGYTQLIQVVLEVVAAIAVTASAGAANLSRREPKQVQA